MRALMCVTGVIAVVAALELAPMVEVHADAAWRCDNQALMPLGETDASGRGTLCATPYARHYARCRERRVFSDLDFDVFAGHADAVSRNVFAGGIERHLPRLDVEARAVPWALDFVAANLTLAQRAAFVRAVVCERVELAAEVEQGNPLARNFDTRYRLP
jgi:hypothetical protein